MSTYYTTFAALVAINCILALGAAVPFASGRLAVCFGSFMGVGGLAAAITYSTGSTPFVIALAVGVGAGGTFGFFIAKLAQKTEGFVFSVLTLSCGEITRILIIHTPSLGGALGFSDIQTVPGIFYPLFALLIATSALGFFFRGGIWAALLAVKNDKAWATALGIDPSTHQLWALTAGAAIAGLAGGLYVHTVGILEPRDFGFSKSLEILLYPVIGGTSRAWGPLAGALLLTVLPEVLRFSQDFRMMLYGAAVIIFSIFLPNGISGYFLLFSKELQK